MERSFHRVPHPSQGIRPSQAATGTTAAATAAIILRRYVTTCSPPIGVTSGPVNIDNLHIDILYYRRAVSSSTPEPDHDPRRT